MRVSAVYAAVRLISGSIATLPCSIYRRTADGGREKANDHPLWWLLNEQPSPRFTAASMWTHGVSQMLLRGDGIAYLKRKSPFSPEVEQIIPVKRDNVVIIRVGDRLAYRIGDIMPNGEVKYFTADQDDVIHIPGDFFNGLQSLSVIQSAARQGIGISIRADEHAARTFGTGANIQYAVKTPKQMSMPQQDSFRHAWVEKYGGSSGPSPIPLVLTEGMEIEELSLSPADSQLLESRKFNVSDIARAFGVPPFMIGDVEKSTSWGSGIEAMGIGFVRYTLLPILSRLDQELNRKLFPVRDRYFIEHNVDGLLQGDSKAQAEYFGKALGGPGSQGWMCVNEVRRLKNLPPDPNPECDGVTIARAAPVPGAGADPGGDEPADPADPAAPNDPAEPAEPAEPTPAKPAKRKKK
jgi:HK97 family phage portal protein